MAIRGRRYPAKSLVHGIVYANPVPRGFVRWTRPVTRPPFRQIHLPVTALTQNNAPGPPIASVNQRHRNTLPTLYRSHTIINRSMAGVQPNALIFAFKQHRPTINVQSFAHRVTIMHPSTIPNTNPIAHSPIYHRAQSINRPVINRTKPVTVINPPIQINRTMYDMNRLARQRTSQVMMTTPNRRGQ